MNDGGLRLVKEVVIFWDRPLCLEVVIYLERERESRIYPMSAQSSFILVVWLPLLILVISSTHELEIRGIMYI